MTPNQHTTPPPSVPLRDVDPPATCPGCGRRYESDDGDESELCPECRAVVEADPFHAVQLKASNWLFEHRDGVPQDVRDAMLGSLFVTSWLYEHHADLLRKATDALVATFKEDAE